MSSSSSARIFPLTFAIALLLCGQALCNSRATTWEMLRRHTMPQSFRRNSTSLHGTSWHCHTATVPAEFRVEVCTADTPTPAGTCQYEVRITRSAAGPCPNPHLSNDSVTERLVKQRFGPDAFDVTFVGPERQAAMPWHTHFARFSHGCMYRFPVGVSLQGTYAVSVKWVYRDYDAYNERLPKWFDIVGQYVLRDYPVTCTATGMTAETALRQAASPDTPLCKSSRARARWIGDEWVPYDCRYPKFGCRTVRAWDKRVCWAGDSHGRKTWGNGVGLCRKAGGKSTEVVAPDWLRKISRIRPLGADYLVRLPDIRVVSRFLFDPFGSRVAHTAANRSRRADLLQEVYRQFPQWVAYFDMGPVECDTVVVSVGNWFTSYLHWSLEESIGLLQLIVPLIGTGFKRVVWMLSPAVTPEATGAKRVLFKDWRNSYRHALLNEFLIEIVEAHGQWIVDSFSPTYSRLIADPSSDGLHFGEPYQTAILAMVRLAVEA